MKEVLKLKMFKTSLSENDFETEHCAFKSKDCNVKNHRYIGTIEIIFNLNQVISIFNLEI